jgi:predicted nucleic acid-binding protein
VVAKAGLIVLDSNVFIIDLRYPRDRNYRANRSFLARLPAIAPAATTLVNVLEVCGILSFNLKAQQVRELYHYLPERYQVSVLPPPTLPTSLPAFPVERLLTLMTKKLSFGDALVLAAVEAWLPQAACFVSWNARHFRGKTPLPVKTPREFLAEIDRVARPQA